MLNDKQNLPNLALYFFLTYFHFLRPKQWQAFWFWQQSIFYSPVFLIYSFVRLTSCIFFSIALLADVINSFLSADLAFTIVIATFLLLYTSTITSTSSSICLLSLCLMHFIKLLVDTVNGFLTIGFVLIVIVTTFLPLTVGTLTSLLLSFWPLLLWSKRFFICYGSSS